MDFEELEALLDDIRRLLFKITVDEHSALFPIELILVDDDGPLIVDINDCLFSKKNFWGVFDSLLRGISSLQEACNQNAPLNCGFSYQAFLEFVRSQSPSAYAVVVSAIVLLSLVYQYLIGYIDRGGSKAYSSGSLDFRDTYISIVLFQGAYVWIKFREVAFKGVYRKGLLDKRGRITKVVFEPRFKPPRENGRVLQWIYLGQYATPEKASILYQIAAFYYHEDGGLLDLEDGRFFTIPRMSEEERRLTGMEKRAWVKAQAKKVYEDFKKEKANVTLSQKLLEAREDQETQGHDEGFAVSNGHSLYIQEGSTIPVSQLTPNTHSGMGINSSNQLDSILTLVANQQELISYQQQQLQEINAQTSELQNQQHIQKQQLQECRAQISELQNQQHVQQQQLQESRIQISQLQDQRCLQQQLQDINQGASSYEVEMEQIMHQQNYPPLMTLPHDRGEAQEDFI